MASPCLSVHPWAKLRTLPRGSPAAGLGALCPSAKALTGGSADLLNFYATTYAVAYGQQRSHPLLSGPTGSGFVFNNQSALSRLLRPCSAAEGQATATSTTAEHFGPLWLPDGRSLLPRHVHQPGSGYLQQGSPSCLRAAAGSPQHMRLLQDSPKTSRDHGTKSCCTHPVQPDVLQKATISIKELSGFTKATPRSGNVLPALPAQPLGFSITTTDYPPFACSHGGEKLPALPGGSERGSGFSRVVPSSLGAEGLRAVDDAVPLVSRGTQASTLGQQGAGRKELSGFTINHGQYVPSRQTLSPARCWRDPSWTARPVGGIQPQRPSGFGTNNHPTGLGGVNSHLSA